MRAKLDYAASVLGAPISYAAAPAVGSIPVVAPQPEPTQPTPAANTPRASDEDDIAPGVDLVPARPKQRPRPEIDIDDPYTN
jgi:hypothetical protein